MKQNVCKGALALAFITLSAFTLAAGSPRLKFQATVHDFGQILISDGPVKCSFTATNTSADPVLLQSVVSSCGCTVPEWPREAIAPGKTASIKVTYSNDEGPYPFDKTLTVKVVGESAPIILHIRGISQEKIKPDKEVYTTLFGGAIGMLTDSFKTGNIEQGRSRSDQTTVANLSAAPVKIGFSGVSESLNLELKPNPVPAHAHATLYYTVNSRKDLWGWNEYTATVTINGKSDGRGIKVRAFTAENFSSLTKEQKSLGSRPVFKESTFSFGHKKRGALVEARFFCENKGKASLHVHKIDTDCKGAVPGEFKDIPAGQSGHFTVRLDTENLPQGEALIIVTLTTNSPFRPVVNLFLAGWID